MINMLATILGGLGSGKTLLMVILAYYQKRKIISNFELYFDKNHYQIQKFNLNKFIKAEYEDCVILLDEAYTYLESRVSSKEINLIFSYILFQSRKKNVELYITCQLLSSIDKRYRELSDVYIIADRDLNEIDFEYVFVTKKEISIIKFMFEKVQLFFEYYDTNEVIPTKNEKILFDTQDIDEKEEQIQKYSNEIEEFYNNLGILHITKDLIEKYMITHDYIPKFLLKAIFGELSLRRKLLKNSENSNE